MQSRLFVCIKGGTLYDVLRRGVLGGQANGIQVAQQARQPRGRGLLYE